MPRAPAVRPCVPRSHLFLLGDCTWQTLVVGAVLFIARRRRGRCVGCEPGVREYFNLLATLMAAYRRVYDSRHLQADCREPGSAPEPYARQSSVGYLYLLPFHSRRYFGDLCRTYSTYSVVRFVYSVCMPAFWTTNIAQARPLTLLVNKLSTRKTAVNRRSRSDRLRYHAHTCRPGPHHAASLAALALS